MRWGIQNLKSLDEFTKIHRIEINRNLISPDRDHYVELVYYVHVFDYKLLHGSHITRDIPADTREVRG